MTFEVGDNIKITGHLIYADKRHCHLAQCQLQHEIEVIIIDHANLEESKQLWGKRENLLGRLKKSPFDLTPTEIGLLKNPMFAIFGSISYDLLDDKTFEKDLRKLKKNVGEEITLSGKLEEGRCLMIDKKTAN